MLRKRPLLKDPHQGALTVHYIYTQSTCSPIQHQECALYIYPSVNLLTHRIHKGAERGPNISTPECLVSGVHISGPLHIAGPTNHGTVRNEPVNTEVTHSAEFSLPLGLSNAGNVPRHLPRPSPFNCRTCLALPLRARATPVGLRGGQEVGLGLHRCHVARLVVKP